MFTLALGPPGGRRGVRAHESRPPPPLVWYVNGHMTPALQMRRGLAYSFLVNGGDDPHSPALYHPLVLRTERGDGDRILAGVEYSRRGRAHPATAGRLCVARHAPDVDPRRVDEFATFRAYNRSLVWNCSTVARDGDGDGQTATLTVTPDSSWPDRVRYDSFTHAGTHHYDY